jgi:hypothetical protein
MFDPDLETAEIKDQGTIEGQETIEDQEMIEGTTEIEDLEAALDPL